MSRYEIDDRNWKEIEPWLELPRRDNQRAGNQKDNREIVNAVIYRMRTGIAWRDLPACYGPWQTVYRRYRKWVDHGCWERLFENLTKDYDDEYLS